MKAKSPLYLSFFFLGIAFHLAAQITVESGVELTILSGETITAEGDVNNAGIISGKGVLNIAGDYTNTGTIAIIIGPDQSTHTTINVTGAFTPGGDFTVSTDSYTPMDGDKTTIITSGSTVSSIFSNADDNNWLANYNLPNSGDFTISYLSALPVELVFFTGRVMDRQTQLNWQTASELNNDRFEIERSQNGKDWTRIGIVPGKGNSSAQNDYQFTDSYPPASVNYYRLKQVDFDGSFEYSPIVSILIRSNKKLELFPNPTKGPVIIRGFNLGNYQITDSFGNLVKEGSIENSTISIVDLPPGVYFFQIAAGNTTKTEAVIKQ